MPDANIQNGWPPNLSRTLSQLPNANRGTGSKAALAAVRRVFRGIYCFCASGTQRVVQLVVVPPRFQGFVAWAASCQEAMAAR